MYLKCNLYNEEDNKFWIDNSIVIVEAVEYIFALKQVFFSDHSIAGEGFAASYMILNATTSCGGDFHNALLNGFVPNQCIYGTRSLQTIYHCKLHNSQCDNLLQR